MQKHTGSYFRITTALVLALAAPLVQAQYKCVVGGKTVYADAPCAPNAKHVGALEDRLTADQQIQRLEQSIKERRERNRIDGRQNAEFDAQQRAIASQAARENAQAAADSRAKAARCTDTQREMRYNQQAQARYKDWGWQNSLSQREAEAKAMRETIDRDCR